MSSNIQSDVTEPNALAQNSMTQAKILDQFIEPKLRPNTSVGYHGLELL